MGELLPENLVNNFQRYEQKAWGWYIAASKNWELFGNLGLHVGLNKNTWESDPVESDNPNAVFKDKDLNLFFGIDKEINRSFSVILECDAALNDNQDKYKFDDLAFGRGKGFINAGLRWAVVPNILVEINFNDLQKNSKADYVNREIKIMYSESF